MTRFRYCIAHPYSEDNPEDLCFYFLGSPVLDGTTEDAQSDLQYVNKYSPRKEGETPWGIYKLKFELLEN